MSEYHVHPVPGFGPVDPVVAEILFRLRDRNKTQTEPFRLGAQLYLEPERGGIYLMWWDAKSGKLTWRLSNGLLMQMEMPAIVDDAALRAVTLEVEKLSQRALQKAQGIEGAGS